MKFGQRLVEESVREWHSYNLDYAQLKAVVKLVTTPGNGTSIPVPGHEAPAMRERDDQMFNLLLEECTHTDTFIKSKRLEAASRLSTIERRLDEANRRNGLVSQNLEKLLRARQRYSSLEADTLKARNEIGKIMRFSSANRLAVRKLVKKYKKWTGSTAIEARVDEDILSRLDFFSTSKIQALADLQADLLQRIRAPFINDKLLDLNDEPIDPATHPTPIITKIPILAGADSTDVSPTSTLRGELFPPTTTAGGVLTPAGTLRSPRPRQKEAAADAPPPVYWSEYDHPDSEDGGEFAIYVDPDAPWFPGQKTLGKLYEKVHGLISRKSSRAQLRSDEEEATSSDEEPERAPLPSNARHSRTYGALHGLPSYAASNRASWRASYRASWRPQPVPATVGPDTSTLCLVASVLLLLISGFLTFSTRRKLQGEVDVAVMLAVVSVLCFAVVGMVRWWTVERDLHSAARGDLVDPYDPHAGAPSVRERLAAVFTCVGDVVKVSLFCVVCFASGALLFALFR